MTKTPSATKNRQDEVPVEDLLKRLVLTGADIVRIGDEATLKHFHRQGDTVMLLADNAAVCPPMIYAGPQLNEIQIEGRAVGFCRGL